jgi:hypothetical protein
MANGELPTVIIIGAMKCATSSLHYYMGLHPGIWMSRQKELNFFNFDDVHARGEAWYRSWFRTELPVRGEASPGYSAYPKFRDVPERMRAVVPNAKLIYLVRDPVERLVSHYLHNVLESKESKPLADAVHEPGNPYVARSLYGMQLGLYLRHWSLDRILIVRRRSLLEDRDATLARVFRFVGADPAFRDFRFGWHRHRTSIKRRKTALGRRVASTALMRVIGRLPQRVRWPIEDLVYLPLSRRLPRPVIDSALRADLESRFRSDLEVLSDLTGEPFDDWLS